MNTRKIWRIHFQVLSAVLLLTPVTTNNQAHSACGLNCEHLGQGSGLQNENSISIKMQHRTPGVFRLHAKSLPACCLLPLTCALSSMCVKKVRTFATLSITAATRCLCAFASAVLGSRTGMIASLPSHAASPAASPGSRRDVYRLFIFFADELARRARVGIASGAEHRQHWQRKQDRGSAWPEGLETRSFAAL